MTAKVSQGFTCPKFQLNFTANCTGTKFLLQISSLFYHTKLMQGSNSWIIKLIQAIIELGLYLYSFVFINLDDIMVISISLL